ncbi:MAG: ParB/RepB/Spo0J family partition protein [Chloroflexota bacterium]|nr:ParB/RepB/Spo0J family partition protein [Chloroflexota bacterium]
MPASNRPVPLADRLLSNSRRGEATPERLSAAAEASFAPIERALLIPIERLSPSRDNPRQTFRNLDELAESIADRGLMQPLLVRRDPERPGNYMTIAGARRLMAAIICRGSEDPEVRGRVEMLPCIVSDETDEQAFADALAENLARDDLTRAEAMAAVLRLEQQYGWSAREIGRRTGRSFPDVAEMLRVAKDKDLAPLLQEELISPTAVGEIRRLPEELRPEAIAGVRDGRIRKVQDVRKLRRLASQDSGPLPVTQIDHKGVYDIIHPSDSDASADRTAYERAHPRAGNEANPASLFTSAGGAKREAALDFEPGSERVADALGSAEMSSSAEPPGERQMPLFNFARVLDQATELLQALERQPAMCTHPDMEKVLNRILAVRERAVAASNGASAP